MRLAFVIKLGNDTRPAEGFFEGWVEEVDSFTEFRFRSTSELLKFLGQRFDICTASRGKSAACEGKQVRIGKKNSRKERESP